MYKDNNVLFSGVMSALVSPMNEDGSIKENTVRRLVDWHLKEGFSGFYLCGATGEGPAMQVKDRMRLVEVAQEANNGRGKLIVHVGAIDLKSAVELAKHAGKIGVDAVSSVPPFFYGYGEKEIAQYYTALSEASGLPMLMYASPLAGIKITWDMVDRLLDIGNMIGLKWTNYDYYEMHRIKELRGGNVNVINGPDECLLCGLTMGADGGIGGTYNVMPKLFVNIYRYFQEGNIEAARREQFKVDRLINILRRFGASIPSLKVILAMLGYDCGYCTYPLKRLTAEEQQALRDALKDIRYEEEYI